MNLFKTCPQPMAVNRRRLLLGAAVVTAMPLAGCGGGDDDDGVVQTTSGAFRGETRSGVTSYLGLPYAQAPVGALRFRAPQPVQAKAGVTDAKAFGPASVHTVGSAGWIYTPETVQSEDCLSLNVWTPDRQSRSPVIVWLHGGGFRAGATRMPLMDGARLAALGVVVVTVNYRLGMLGLLSHPDLTDPGNGSLANWQMQDMSAALQWVRQNIAAFGGDPGQVTVMGQSGGANHTAFLAQNPTSRACFQRAILLSPPMVTPPVSMTMGDAALYAEALASGLGTTVRGLRDVQAQTLYDAEIALSRKLPATVRSGFAFPMAPLVDGKVCMGDWTRLPWPQDMPVAITYTANEGAFWFDLVDPATGKALTPAPAADAAQLLAMTQGQVGSADAAAAVIDAYTKAALAEGRSTAPADLWIDLFGDRLLRNFGTRYAATIAGAGARVYLGTWMHPVMAPGRGAPHCAELPFVFGTYGLDYYKAKVGAGPVQAQLSDKLMRTIVSFARDAQPKLASGESWPVYRPGTATSVRWGEGGTANEVLATAPKVAQMKVWDALLGY